MINLEDYLKIHKMKNGESIKKLISSQSLVNAKLEGNDYYIGKYYWKIDYRRIPKKTSSIHIRASIIQAINDRYHLDHKMIGIEESHFLEYLLMLTEFGVIRLVKNNKEDLIESYIIGNVIPNEIISKRSKLLHYLDKKFDIAMNKAVEIVTIKTLDNIGL